MRPDLRAASRTEISPPVLGACQHIDLSLDRHRLGREYGIEAERRAVQLTTGQAVTDTDAIGLSPRLDAYSAAGAAASMDAVGHSGSYPTTPTGSAQHHPQSRHRR